MIVSMSVTFAVLSPFSQHLSLSILSLESEPTCTGTGSSPACYCYQSRVASTQEASTQAEMGNGMIVTPADFDFKSARQADWYTQPRWL